VGDWTMWQVARDHTSVIYYYSTAFYSALHGCGMARDDDLPRSIEIGGCHDLPLRRLAAGLVETGVLFNR